MGVGEVAILGVGMHPWGKFVGKSFVDLGVHAANAALRDAEVEWGEIQFVSGANTVRNGSPGGVSGAGYEKFTNTKKNHFFLIALVTSVSFLK